MTKEEEIIKYLSESNQELSEMFTPQKEVKKEESIKKTRLMNLSI